MILVITNDKRDPECWRLWISRLDCDDELRMPVSELSPMALSSPEPKPSIFRKSRPGSPQISSASSYLSLLSQADARARSSASQRSLPASTPALSLSSSITTSTEDTILHETDDNADGLAFPQTPPNSEQVFTTVHTEFGHCANDSYRYTSEHSPGTNLLPVHEDPPYYILLSTYISYLFLICLGHLRDFFGKRLRSSAYKHLMPSGVRIPPKPSFPLNLNNVFSNRVMLLSPPTLTPSTPDVLRFA